MREREREEKISSCTFTCRKRKSDRKKDNNLKETPQSSGLSQAMSAAPSAALAELRKPLQGFARKRGALDVLELGDWI